MSDLPKIVITREALIVALEDRRQWAVDLDERYAREHIEEEQDYLATFRAGCREALTWDYEQAKKNHFSVRDSGRYRPTCPTSVVSQLERVLNVLRVSRQTKYTLSEHTYSVGNAYWLLTHDPDLVEKDACS